LLQQESRKYPLASSIWKSGDSVRLWPLVGNRSSVRCFLVSAGSHGVDSF
jgi:hypothetical protein